MCFARVASNQGRVFGNSVKSIARSAYDRRPGGGDGSRTAAFTAMAQIIVDRLVKTFRVSTRPSGLWGAVRGLARRNHRTVRALDGISFALDAGELVGYI